MINDKGINKKNLSEQWNLSGNCDLCRRKNYCRKRCKVASRRADKFLSSAVHAAMVDTLYHTESTHENFSKAVDEVLENAKNNKK